MFWLCLVGFFKRWDALAHPLHIVVHRAIQVQVIRVVNVGKAIQEMGGAQQEVNNFSMTMTLVMTHLVQEIVPTTHSQNVGKDKLIQQK